MRNRIPGWIVFVLSTLIVLAVFVQAYLITAYVAGNGDALDAHGSLGFITHAVEVVVFLVALWGWWGRWRWLGFVFLLPLVGTVQLALAPDSEASDKGNPWVHGFHGLLALVVLVLAAVIAHRARRELRRERPAGADAGMPPPLP